MGTLVRVHPQWEGCCDDSTSDSGMPVNSDAIMRARPIFTNGYETPGQVYRFGYLDFQGYNLAGDYTGIYGDEAGSSNCARGIFDWHANGGRDGGAYITSHTNPLGSDFGGSYICYTVPIAIPFGVGLTYAMPTAGCIGAFNLFGNTPTATTEILGLGTTDLNDVSSKHTFFNAGVWLSIAPDLTIIAHAASLFGSFSLGVKVPANDWFLLELHAHRQNGIGSTSGFIMAQLYTLNGPVTGTPCVRALGVQTSTADYTAYAIGSAVASRTANAGMNGLGIDDNVLLDNTGPTKRFWGEVFVGMAIPTGVGDATNSLIGFDSRHTIEDSAHVVAPVGTLCSHGDTERWKNVNGLLNVRVANEAINWGDDSTGAIVGTGPYNPGVTYGEFGAGSGAWEQGPYYPGRLDSIDGDFGSGPFDPATLINPIHSNIIHDENPDLYRITLNRTGLAMVDGIQLAKRTGFRGAVGGVFGSAVFGGGTGLFSELDDFVFVIPPEDVVGVNTNPNYSARRNAKIILRDINGTWNSPEFIALTDAQSLTTVHAAVTYKQFGRFNTTHWTTYGGFQLQEKRTFLENHPITGVPFNQLPVTTVYNFQIGIAGSFFQYDNWPDSNPGIDPIHLPVLSPLANHRWIRFDVCELGYDVLYRRRIPNTIERGPIAPIAFLILSSVNTSTRHVVLIERSDDWDGTIVTASINWGDGNTELVTIGSAPTHTYAVPGRYNITETVTDNDGLTNSFSLSVDVFIPAVIGFSATNPTGDQLVFTDTSVGHDETILTWHWDFGDGGTSTLQNPTHTYAADAAYNVTLTITTSIGGPYATTTGFNVPFPVSSECNPSAKFMANTANVQGDNFHGDNPPLPNYANTAAFSPYLNGVGGSFREAYDFTNAYLDDGIEFIIDSTNQFNGHNTFRMAFGKPAGPVYAGAGWFTRPTNDANSENFITYSKAWARVRFKADSGLMTDPFHGGGFASDNFFGQSIIEFTNDGNAKYSIITRGNKIYLDSFNGAGFIDNSLPDTLILGAGYVDVLMLYDGSVANQVRIAVWIEASCQLAGKSPKIDHTYTGLTEDQRIDHALGGFSSAGPFFFNCYFSPQGANKFLWVADWETMPYATDNNPFSVVGN